MLTGPKTVLMIRARDQAADFVAELAVSTPVVYAPMVQIEPLNADQTLPAADVVVFTSSNAVRLFAAKTQTRSMDIVCVGSITARIAAKSGFHAAQTFETAEQLVASFQSRANDALHILYPRAETVSLDIASALSAMGHQATDIVIYRQIFQALSHEAKELLESSSVIVPIFSREIAKRFRDTITALKPHDLTLVCISAPVAAIFDGFNVEIAKKPTRAALIAQIKPAYRGRKPEQSL